MNVVNETQGTNAPLADELAALAQRTERDLAERRAVSSVSREFTRALPLVLVVPGVWLMVQVARAVAGGAALERTEDGFRLGVVIAILLFALAAVVPWLLVVRARERARRTRAEEALGVLDQHLGLADRLTAAHEFLGATQRSGFEEAAIEDARAAASRARAAVLPTVELELRPRVRGALVLAGAVLLALVGAHVQIPERKIVDVPKDGASGSEVVAGLASERSPHTADAEPLVPEATSTRPSEQRKPQPAQRSDARATDVPDAVKKTRGETREGTSSDAQASSGAGQAKGSPSNQEQKSDGEAKTKEPPKAQKETPAREDEEQPKKQAEEDSGSTAGKGSGRGSNKNSVATPWSSKDQVDTPDDQEVEDDRDFEDDAEEQKARGGMQPNLRDRRPPVSRDLSIAFGNRPSPDANGRGGPSDQKKSRGTASLVLGVPVPDRVKGQPNKGKTKITQERVEPRAEDAELTNAVEHTPSVVPLGTLPSPRPSRFASDAVRAYFDALRSQPTP